MIAIRPLAPCSKLYCYEQWLREEVYLREATSLKLHQLYRSMDFFETHKAKIEKALYFSMVGLTNADVDLIFYDTTSPHFEVGLEDTTPLCRSEDGKDERECQPLRKRGHSKNGSDNVPQIVVGLAVTRDDLPERSFVFPGNTADVSRDRQARVEGLAVEALCARRRRWDEQ